MRLHIYTLSVLVSISIIFSEVYGLNILGIFPYQGKSHFFAYQPYLRELARRGHNLTVISHFPQKDPIENYHDISLAGRIKVLEDVFPIERSYMSFIGISFFLVNSGIENCRVLLEHEQVQALWKTQTKFDVVVLEQFNSDCALGLAYKLDAPVVGINSHIFMPYHYARFGINYNPSYVSFQFFDGGTRPTFYQRLERTIFHTYFNLLYKYFSQRVDQNTLAEHFDDIPPLEELARETKFLLYYQNFLLSGSSLLLPSNVIEVCGYHVVPPKSLPTDIKKFIDESQHGVIYISFGSMLKASTTPKDKLEAIIGALSELPQRVIWKWDEKSLPQNPKNIFLSDWLPQNDILAHPKVLAFFSHCGLLGTTEAIYHGVPVVGMPVFGDQPANGAAVEESGLGVQIQVKDLTKETLLEKFKIVLNPEFKNKVKKLSEAWRDRPISAMDSAIHWTEFAARHRNFTFRTRAADVPFYQYLYLDVFCVIFGIVFIFVYIIKVLLSLVVSKKSKEFKNKIKKKKN